MKRRWSGEELIERWTLAPDEVPLLANKAGATRLGFAVLLRFFAGEGRLPRSKDEGLRERELRKLSVLSEAITAGFRDRGFDGLTATLAAQVAVTVFDVAMGRWLDQDGEQPLSEFVHDTLGALRSVTADPAGQPHAASPGVPTQPGASR